MNSRPGESPVAVGEILAGKYRVDRVLGVGGMGVVVAAHHIDLDEKVAIKFLLPQSLASSEAVARFAREARAAVKIKSEHVARVSDVGKLENGAPYMVMEYLEGGDLAAWLSQRGALPVQQAVEFVLQACEAIAEAHSLGIVHRDLKPGNLFVIRRADGTLSTKVLDFGISKVTGLGASSAGASMTRTAALMGSPLYMSPEQMQTPKEVDSRSDIWSLGVILYELVTGTSPFVADTMPELVLKIVGSPPPPLRDGRPDAPDGLEAVILKCLEKDRGKRYETIGELAVALLPFAPKRSKTSVERISGVMRGAGMSASALAMPPSSEAASADTPAATAASWGKTGTKAPAGKTTLVSLTLGALLVVGIGGSMMLRPSRPLPEPSSATATQRPPETEPSSAPSSTPKRGSTPAEAPLASAEPGSPSSGLVVSPVGSASPQASAAPLPASTSHAGRSGSPKPPLHPTAAQPVSVAPATTAATPTTPTPPPKKPNCDPNFYFDAQGEKHFKPECF